VILRVIPPACQNAFQPGRVEGLGELLFPKRSQEVARQCYLPALFCKELVIKKKCYSQCVLNIQHIQYKLRKQWLILHQSFRCLLVGGAWSILLRKARETDAMFLSDFAFVMWNYRWRTCHVMGLFTFRQSYRWLNLHDV